MNKDGNAVKKLRTGYAIAVEGRDDVAAVSRAADALIIPTHGFGITNETWNVLEKAYKEKGLIILTDPDHAGEQIRKRLAERFPDSIHAYVARADALDADDIGIENAEPEVIKDALGSALRRADALKDAAGSETQNRTYADISLLTELGLAGCDGAGTRRAAVCKALGIGYGNAAAMIKKLKGFGIDSDELREAVKTVK